MINKEDIYESQRKWALSIVDIGKAKNDFTLAQKLTQEFLENQYDFNLGNVQFKPLKHLCISLEMIYHQQCPILLVKINLLKRILVLH